ncbi:ABC transporter ATP-binding protein [Enorma massiliensis]|uniref:ABC transporter ATP-binding protein n=1 Tax=Enorma massiliensis TaxID=1472761 RepID=UPI00195A3EDE|nr:ABC transporter ATP-binding protein [Enorma massiliensis]MBM6893096.1 ABC transporter ATP-binding protein [Enorma massiliensis]
MFKLLKRFGGSYRANLVLGPLCKLIEVVFDLFTPIIVAYMIDAGVGTRSVQPVLAGGGILLAMAAVAILFALACQKMASRASQGMGTSIRHSLYEHINALSHADLDRFGTPSLTTRITNDVNQVQLAIALGIRQLMRWPFLAVGSLVAALAIDVRLGLIFVVSMAVVGGLFWFVMKACIPYYRSMQAKLDRIALIVREGLSGVRVVRAFVREGHERRRLADAAQDQAATAIAVGRLSSVLNPVTFLVMYLAVCAILWAGGIQVNIGELTQGQVVAFVSYMTQALLSIVYVANLVVVFTKASASAARVNEVLACQPSVTDEGAEPVELWGSAWLPGVAEQADAGLPDTAEQVDADLPSGAEQVPTLVLRNVSFAYPGAAADAVHDATLTLMPGQTLGVIGGTGSGKSTLVSLLPRLYDATEGAVEVLGRDVRAWQLKQLRQVVGMVPQQAMLVSGTIRSNLIWRDAKATDDDLWRALELAQAAEFVRALADGLDAPVEAGGKNFSGGQRQRLTIARALVGAPKLLILDDSASALDYKTDAALRVALASYGRDAAASGELPPAVVVVSQRVASVRAADLICVMRRGNVVGLGTHDELVRTCAIYQEICASQGVEDETVSPGMRQFHPAQLSHETVSPGTTVSRHEEVRHG